MEKCYVKHNYIDRKYAFKPCLVEVDPIANGHHARKTFPGKKVNSAIDNASSYYQARSLTNRASDLDSLLDSMGQGIQTIEAANQGIEAVTSFIEQLKSESESANA